ncbi:MAG: adenine deaminase [Calditrichaeota bacterium]|nr:adenine deaminase [Calditrichota bacterium]
MNITVLSTWQSLLKAARGDHPADLLIRNARIVNVFTGQVEEESVAVHRGVIVGIGEYEADRIVDLAGAFLAPGLIEGHVHIESSKLTPARFAQVVVPRGTTTVIADPHEIANVFGIDGIRYMLRGSLGLPLDVFYMLPSCVPATTMETAGAKLSADDLRPLLSEPSVRGIGELMDFPGALNGDPRVLSKSALAGGKRPVDGHSPGLTGKQLAAYLIAGPATDHECNALAEAEEKLARGMRIMIREGSAARNLDALIGLVTPANERRCLLVSDDRRPGDLMEQGHLDHLLRRATAAGLDPVTAIRMVTLNAAETFHLFDRGGIRPGWKADLVAFDDLKSFKVQAVWKDGIEVARDGRLMVPLTFDSEQRPSPLPVPPLPGDAFDIPDHSQPVRVIGIVPDKIITESLTMSFDGIAGRLDSHPEEDVLKLAVIERHTGQGRMALGFVKGLGLREGAIASTVAHDSHNIIVAGADDESMFVAVNRLVALGGGQVVVRDGLPIAEMPLPIAGLMSNNAPELVAKSESALLNAAASLGSPLADPLMALSFLALPVIPQLKLTDHGLVDVDRFELVSLYS